MPDDRRVHVINSPMSGTFRVAAGITAEKPVFPETILGHFTWHDWYGGSGSSLFHAGVKGRILEVCVCDGDVDYWQVMFKVEISN